MIDTGGSPAKNRAAFFFPRTELFRFLLWCSPNAPHRPAGRRPAGLHCRNPGLPHASQKTLPHHGRTFMASPAFPPFSGKMHAPRQAGVSFVFPFRCSGCVSVYYHFTPGIPFDRNLFAALGMLPARSLRTPPAPACVGLAFLAVPHALCAVIAPIFCYFRGMNIDIFPQPYGARCWEQSISYPVHVLQHTERQGGKRLRQRQPTPRFRRNECPKEIAASGRTALHSTDVVRFPFFAGYPSGNPHTPPNDGGCTPPHTKPLFRAAPGRRTSEPERLHTALSRDYYDRLWWGGDGREPR